MPMLLSYFMYLFPAYRFQLAGYRDEQEYLAVTKLDTVSSATLNHLCHFTLSSHVYTQSTHPPKVERWPHNNYVKKLRRRDGYFYYYDKTRECPAKDLQKVKLYMY